MKRLLLLWAAFAAAVTVDAVHPLAYSSSASLCDLKICNCSFGSNLTCICDAKIQEIVLQPVNLPTSLGSITIQKCFHVTIASRSIHNILPLRSVTLTNIAKIDLEREAFFWKTTQIHENYPDPGIEIVITNSSISDIQSEAFKGHINAIYFNNVNITSVSSLAFANLAVMEKIQMMNCRIERFAPKSFNKLILESFVIEGGIIGNVPSNTMNSVEVLNDLRFEAVQFNTIRSSAFKIIKPKSFKLTSCQIIVLEGEAFQVVTKGDIIIDDNIFESIHEGAFLGIHLDPREVSQKTLVLENNTLTRFDDGALALNNTRLHIIIDRIKINRPCDCNAIKIWSTKLVNYPKQKTPSFAKFMWCQKGNTETVVSEFEKKHCLNQHSKIPLVLTIIIGILIFLICICFVGFWLYKRHVKQYSNVPTRENNGMSVLSSNSTNRIIVIPERKIFKETEINFVTESVEPMKEYIVPQKVNQ